MPRIPGWPSDCGAWREASYGDAPQKKLWRKTRPDACPEVSKGLLDAWPYGDIYVLEQLWQRLGMAEVLREVLDPRKLEFPLERALFVMVANRTCAPASKLSYHEQWLAEEVRIAGTEGLDLHHLYRAMDRRWNRTSGSQRCALPAVNAGSGNAVFGSMPSATKRIMRATWIMSTFAWGQLKGAS